MIINYSQSWRLGVLLSVLAIEVSMAANPEIEKRLASVVRAQLHLEVCSDTARSYLNDEESALKYQEAAGTLYSRTQELGWTAEEIARAMVSVLSDQEGILVIEGDTKEDFQVRNFSGDHCKGQLVAAKDYLRGNNIPTPD